MLVLERKMALELKVITFNGLGLRKAWESLINRNVAALESNFIFGIFFPHESELACK